MDNKRQLFSNDVSRLIWENKYRYQNGNDETPADSDIYDSWQRTARAIAGVEKDKQDEHARRFYAILDDFQFLPGGRILAGSGIKRQVTLFNCFVMGQIEDSIDGIFDALKQAALTIQQGGGIGCDFSTLRPSGMRAQRVGVVASGPISFMRIWDSMCATLLSTGSRRGAMMATLRCDHPDIETFIAAKQNPGELRHFNLSVLVTDAFMQAITDDADWPLLFPVQTAVAADENDIILRQWSYSRAPVPCRIVKTIKARDLWHKIMQATYDYAEPGVLFIDRINRANNLQARELISATNPCGEIPLPPYGACNLGSINLTRFIRHPFTPEATVDIEAITKTVQVATRFMDNVIDRSRFPLTEQQQQAHGSRRIGLGMTGLADALIMLGLSYQTEAARQQAADIMKLICHTAYATSIELAREKGVFPFFNKTEYLTTPFIQSLPEHIQQAIDKYGIRNSHLTAIAPTGTISLLANNISSGIEPVFNWCYERKILSSDGEYKKYAVTDYAWQLWRAQYGDKKLPETFIDAHRIWPIDHLQMQAALQPYVDNAISKTINIPASYDFEEFQDIYKKAYELGLKGCTTFRPNPITGSILSESMDETSACCTPEREAD